MQRMKLLVSGVDVPRLGTIHDKIYRKFLTKEAELEAKRSEFMMLTALANPVIDPSKRGDWAKEINRSWTNYLGKLFTVDIPEQTPEEEALLEYYQRVVSKVKIGIRKDRKTGGLHLEGLTTANLNDILHY